ncbi:Lrp/AsnC family transcriptional regulator [Salinisphaera sp. USBA-960]|nr:Lrp/AsnC family transcriptional regulator [Salifodinibacter halophilus]NNC25798.1 Lrp/AsnC family transcriptional regulator [Salifodinibacter halophilus]
MHQLDRSDCKILAHLKDNGQLTTNELASKIFLSASQCSRRRARLEKDNYISGYHADLNLGKLGYALTALISITSNYHNQENNERFIELINEETAILEAFELTGPMDYILKVMVPDLEGLTELINDTLLPHESVQHINSAIALKTIKSNNDLLNNYKN